ncbi:unnamed protein product [Schistosoma mattheei]|uniref:Uncharacterized protein n=1 Tax=Schistosoma mattheei TaxID=31246 RepID=A0A183NLU9_9TREM|nr:unnamed protein product [Schistosoma mattheei]
MVEIRDLPQDLFYQICSYLRINDLIALCSVCAQFCHWLHRQSYWKWRSQSLWNGTYPCLPGYLKHPDLLIMGDRGRVVSIFSFKAGLFSNSWLPVFTEYHSHSVSFFSSSHYFD